MHPTELESISDGRHLGAAPVDLPGVEVPMLVSRFEMLMRQVTDPELVRLKHFRKGRNALIDDGGGLPTFAELVVASRFQRSEWNAVWRNNWASAGFYERWDWNAEQGIKLEPPSDLTRVLRAITWQVVNDVAYKGAARSGTFPGLFDVVAWNGDEWMFLECKDPKDALNLNQRLWLKAARSVGIRPDRIAVIDWRWRLAADHEGETRSE